MSITIELDSVEAHLILGPIGDAQIAETLRAARAKGIDGEAASIRAAVLGRVATRIVDQLIPETRIDHFGRDEFAAEVELGLV